MISKIYLYWINSLKIKYKYNGTVIKGKIKDENFCSFVSGLFCKMFFVEIVDIEVSIKYPKIIKINTKVSM